ncbi:MAG TPA: glycosyltransferase [Candidatus Kapabacteria bacterium]|nr:glycosyltransferase [Candidatus Kapabacteria bacterium]
MKLVSIITSTTGRPELTRCIESVRQQTYPRVQHLVVVDGPEHHDRVRARIAHDALAEHSNVDVFYLPYATKQWGTRINAAFSQFAKGDYIAFLDDDNTLEPDHVESLVASIGNRPWAYSLRNITLNGMFVARDNCDALGPLHPTWAEFAQGRKIHHLDTGNFFVQRSVALAMSRYWGWTDFNDPAPWADLPDRMYFNQLLANYPNPICSYRHTFNYEISIDQLDFFLTGNRMMREWYGNKLPSIFTSIADDVRDQSIQRKSATIPKIIHQIWIGPHRRPTHLMQTWKTMHPDWEYRFWGNDEIASHPFRNQRHIDSIPNWAGKCNVIRYELLREYGGVYVDADMECLRPLEDFFLQNDSFACWENERVTPGLVANSILGAIPQNDLMQLMVEELEHTYQIEGPSWKSTGPLFLTRAIEEYKYNRITIYPSHYFYPVHHSGAVYRGEEKPYAHQFWGSTFESYDRDLKASENTHRRRLETARDWARSEKPEAGFPFYEVLLEDPDLSPDLQFAALLGAALSLRQTGRFEERIQLLKKAAQLFPSRIEPVLSLALVYVQMENPISALPLLERAVASADWPEISAEFPLTRTNAAELLHRCKLEVAGASKAILGQPGPSYPLGTSNV